MGAAVGQSEYINASMGHVALVAHWACISFQKVLGSPKARRTGSDDGTYTGWRAHTILVIEFLRKHTNDEDGLLLCDGDDERRDLLVADDGTYTPDEDAGDGDMGDGVAGDGGDLYADDGGAGHHGVGDGDDAYAGDDSDVHADDGGAGDHSVGDGGAGDGGEA